MSIDGPPGVKGESLGGGSPGVQCVGPFMWGSSYAWAEPDGTATKVLAADGTWLSVVNGLKVISTGHGTAGAALGYMIVDTFGAAGQVKVPYYAVS